LGDEKARTANLLSLPAVAQKEEVKDQEEKKEEPVLASPPIIGKRGRERESDQEASARERMRERERDQEALVRERETRRHQGENMGERTMMAKIDK
jgi:hypothetical protein